jgi:hypothetical protein
MSEFGFMYEGPILARQTPGCVLCIAAAGMQPPHACMPGCAICSAGKDKVCPSHRGLEVALEGAQIPHDMGHAFSGVREVVQTFLEGADGSSNTRVKVFGQVGAPDAPPRALTVEITLL